MTKTKKESITTELEALEKIVEWFESQKEINVEKSLEKAKQGALLVKSLKSELKEVENQFEEVIESLQEH